MKKKGKKIIFWLVLLLLIVGGIASCTVYAMNQKPSVNVTSPTYQPIQTHLSTSAQVLSSQNKSFFAPSQVKVKKVLVEQGDLVKEGDLLASFDTNDLSSTLNTQLLNIKNAELTLAESERSNVEAQKDVDDNAKDIRLYNKKIDIYEQSDDPGDITAVTDWKMQVTTLENSNIQLTKMLISDERLEQQKNAIELQKIAYQDTLRMINEGKSSIVAEFDGIITNVSVIEGATTNAASPAVTMESTENLKAVFQIGKYDIDKVKLEQKVAVTVGSSELSGEITHIDSIAQTVNTAQGTASVINAEITVDDPEAMLKIGLEVDINILVFEVANAQVLPVNAVKTDLEGDYVYIMEHLEEDIYKPVKTYIKCGNSSDLYIQIIDKIPDESIIAVNPPAQLIDTFPIFTINRI